MVFLSKKYDREQRLLCAVEGIGVCAGINARRDGNLAALGRDIEILSETFRRRVERGRRVDRIAARCLVELALIHRVAGIHRNTPARTYARRQIDLLIEENPDTTEVLRTRIERWDSEQ